MRVVPWCLVVGLAAVALVTAVTTALTRASTTSPLPGPVVAYGPPTGFGGYTWSGTVHQVSAQWRVPAVTQTNAVGFSATWIGAEAGLGHDPFIQLGAEEVQTTDATGLATFRKPYYLIFWSDETVGFQAQPIVQLSRPGDLIAFDMTQNSRGWKLDVHNLTVGWSRSRQVNYRANQPFTTAEWLQEDPATGVRTTSDAPYASTTTVAFSNLRVNHRPPRLNWDDAHVLSTTSGVYLVPTHESGDAFSLLPASGFAHQYLADDLTYEDGAQPLTLAILESGQGSSSARTGPARQFVDAVAQLKGLLTSQSWPRSDKHRVGLVTQDLTHLLDEALVWSHSGDRSLQTFYDFYLATGLRTDTNRLRTTLGLPAISYWNG